MEEKYRLLKLGIGVSENNMKFIAEEVRELNELIQENLEFITELSAEFDRSMLSSQKET